MIYAHVYDQTVANDYYAAMSQVEKSLELAPMTVDSDGPIGANERALLLDLVNRLAEPQLNAELRLGLMGKIRSVLHHATQTQDPSAALLMSG